MNAEKCDLELCFWTMNPKEQLWTRLKALQVYETANVFVMAYDLDDKESFEKLNSIHLDFKDSNALGAYTILIGIQTKDLGLKLTKRMIDKQEVRQFMGSRGIASYVEVDF